jgi:hypothetical protein
MQIKITRRRGLLAGAGVAAIAGAALLVPLPFANAAPATLTASAATDAGRYQSAAVNTPEGRFNVATNLWNPAVTSGGFTFAYDTTASSFTVSNYNANSYYGPGNEPGCTVGADSEDPDCAWAGSGYPWGTAANPTTADQFGYRADGYTTVSTDPYKPANVAAHNYANDPQFGLQIHAPASYPSIIAGCHWGSCSGTNGAPYPLQTTGIASMESVWTINTLPPAQAGANEAWDASYDIWFDTNKRGVLPATPAALNNPGQNDGAEIMIWVNNRGYNNATPGQPYVEGTIRPAGKLLAADVTIPGIQNTNADGSPLPTTFDVWGGRVRSWDNAIRWNVISFVARNRGYGLIGTTPQPWGGFDAHAFTKYAAYDLHAAGLTCDTELPVTATPTSTVIEQTRCLDPTWWLTSVQAGFEIWNLPTTATLSTTRFAANPVAVSGGVNTGGRAVPPGVPGVAPGTPLVFWGDEFTVSATGCPNATNLGWSIDAQNYAPWTSPPDFQPQGGHLAIGAPLNYQPNPNGAGVQPVTILDSALVETPAGSGNYIATGAGPMWGDPQYVLHGPATVSISMTCPNGQTITTQSSLYIDPSGTVENTLGEAIPGATVTLLRSDTQNGTYTVVPNGSTIMSPDNRTNPDLTDANGGYRWDVQPGWYKVRAEKSGCTAPGSSATFVESPPKQVAVGLPPITDLVLILYCGETGPGPGPEPPSNVDVVINQTTSWESDTGGGYCAEIIATNNSGSPVVWATNVTLPGNIYSAWNFNRQLLSPNRYHITGVEWNSTLAPHASTYSVGYCANN